MQDSVGVRVAIAMVLKSLQPGRYHASYQQFKTIRKLGVANSNMYLALVEGSDSLRATRGDQVKQYLNRSPTYLMWFGRFKQGCLRCIGQDARQNWAITLDAMHAPTQDLEKERGIVENLHRQHMIASVGAYSVIAYGGSFWGNEVFLTDLYGLCKYLRELEDKDFIVIPLLGQFKGEKHSRYHLQPLATTKSSGLPIRE